MPRIAIARRHLRPQLRAGRHAARAAVHPVEVNTTMKSTMRVRARGKINSVVRDRSGPPQRGWLRLRSESRSLSFNGKAPLLTASSTCSRVLVGAEAAARDGAASTAARDMAGSPRRRAEQRHKFVVFVSWSDATSELSRRGRAAQSRAVGAPKSDRAGFKARCPRGANTVLGRNTVKQTSCDSMLVCQHAR